MNNPLKILLLLAVIILLHGCSIIGYNVGKKMDKGNFKPGPKSLIARVEPENMDWGGPNLVEVHKKDSSIITGQFKGYQYEPLDHYRPRYDQFRDSVSGSIGIPVLGSTVNIFMKGDESGRIGIFEGFCKDGLVHNFNMTLQAFGTDEFSSLADNQGNNYDLAALTRMFHGDFPSRSVVAIKPKGLEMKDILLDQVAYARCQRNDRTGLVTGLIIGIIIDTTVTFLVVRGFDYGAGMDLNFTW